MKNQEKIILAVALGLLAVGAGLLAWLYPTPSQIVAMVNAENPKQSAMTAKIQPEVLVALKNAWLNPPVWKTPANKHQMFVSDRFFYFPDSKDIQSVGPETVVQGITLDYIEKYGLDYKSPTLALDDPDGDGFSNKMEFDYKTNPRDAASHPPYLTRLRLNRVDNKHFFMRFQSYENLESENVFFINMLNLPGQPTRQVKKGDKLEGYVIGDFRAKPSVEVKDESTGLVRQEDQSELDLLKPEINFKITLIRGQKVDSPEAAGDFIMLLPGELDKPFHVAQGGEFALPHEPDLKFRLWRLEPSKALLVNLADKQEVQVPLVTEAEKREVPLSKSQPKSPQ